MYDYDWEKFNYGTMLVSSANNIASLLENATTINSYEINIYFDYYFDNRKDA